MRSFLERVMLLPASLLALTLSYALAAQASSKDAERRAVPAPISIPPSEQWDGIDGSWSSFTVRIGTPAQDVRTFVSWDISQIWAVIPEGCSAAKDYDACAQSRGGIFNQTASTTWFEKCLCSLSLYQDLGYYGDGYYGYDDVRLSKGAATLQNSTVVGFALEDFYLGVLGLNPMPTNYSRNDAATSYLSLMKDQEHIPSISFGYTAGASYRVNSTSDAFGSLTLGGFDDIKFTANDLTWPFGLSEWADTAVALVSVNTPSDTSSSPVATELLPDKILINLDAAVPQIWLPIESCYIFEHVFGLTYDDDSELYLVNNTLHQQLLSRNASITFELALSTKDEENISIELPYAAFDVTAKPTYQNLSDNAYYFPLRRAVNASQYTLGRTFFQEAYIAVDYGSETFNVSQRVWQDSSSQHIVTIPPYSAESNAYPGVSPLLKSKSLSGGAIAGIVVGAVAVLALIGVLLLWYLRRRAHARRRAALENEKLGSDAGSDTHGSAIDPATGTGTGSGSGNDSLVIPKAELPGSAPMSHHGSDDHALLASGALSTQLSDHDSSSPSDSRSLRTPNALSGATFVNGRWNGDSFTFIADSPDEAEPGTGTHSSTESSRGTGTQSNSASNYGTGSGTLMSLVSPLSPADSHEADRNERHVFEMAGDMPTVKEKDGKELSEKEAMAHREKVYNGVETPPSPIETREGGVAHAATSREPPRRVRPEEVVRASTMMEGAGGSGGPGGERGGLGMHRAFSFEEMRHDEIGTSSGEGSEELYS